MKKGLTQPDATFVGRQSSTLEESKHLTNVNHRGNQDRGIERVSEKHLGFLYVKKLSAEEKQMLGILRLTCGSMRILPTAIVS
ncbi:hypothetical protein QN372_05505 [Undibacterium sp. RTI2.1]|uniref:hypothetical protein n=1 Tax=unclassified Undibacterium TaxID=2630295 RepID=UPI002B22E7BA|nr:MULTISPECIES: hypothetical protein [unclassified Undibacterium]MEB0030194.1 hypothetical protein [Undibacterium sp. RTI2.1]MEB0116818.1 hypothetical protein [Undibacterium sp. RTI2.2]